MKYYVNVHLPIEVECDALRLHTFERQAHMNRRKAQLKLPHRLHR